MRNEVICIVNTAMDIIDDMRFSHDPEYVEAKIRIGKNLYMQVSCNRGYGLGVQRSGCVSTRNKHSMYEDRYVDMDIATERDYYYNFESPFTVSVKEQKRVREGFKPSGFVVTVYRGKFPLGKTELSRDMRGDIIDALYSYGIR